MRFALSILSALIAISVASSQESRTIKIKADPDVGLTTTHRSQSVSTGSTKLFDADGKLLGEIKAEGSETAFRITILERDRDGNATKFLRVYEKTVDKEDGKTKSLSYSGRTLLFEKVADKFRLGVVGEPALDSSDVGNLLKEVNGKGDPFDLERNLSPGKPVKLGDSWSLPVKVIAQAIDEHLPTDLRTSTATAKLVKLYSKGTSKFGSFEVTTKLNLSGKTEYDGMIAEFDSGSELISKTTIDLDIDGTSTEGKSRGSTQRKGEATITAAGKKLRMVFDTSSSYSYDVSAEVDDPKARVIPKVNFAVAPGE